MQIWIQLPFFFGKQIGFMFWVMGTLSFSLRRAMSLSKFKKLKAPATALKTNLDSGLLLSLQRSCSPNVTLIMNHMNLKWKKCSSIFAFNNVDTSFRYDNVIIWFRMINFCYEIVRVYVVSYCKTPTQNDEQDSFRNIFILTYLTF